jgi:hypothetical protein
MVPAPGGTMNVNGKLEYRAFIQRSRAGALPRAEHVGRRRGRDGVFLGSISAPYGAHGGLSARTNPAGPETAHNEFGRLS